jgi:serine/threonine protein kinase
VLTQRRLKPKVNNWLDESLRLEGLLGEGAEGTVWKARHKDTGNFYAVKILKSEFHGKPEAREQFRQVFHAVRERLAESPHICRLEELWEESKFGPWFSMEYVDHVHLQQYCREKQDTGRPVSPLQICDLLTPIAQSLDLAHSRNILHCDINQHHLMISLGNQGTATLKLIDFGEALILDLLNSDRDSFAWPSGGTPGYVSPERENGRPQSGRSDQFSFAVVVHELLLGYTPSASAPSSADSTISPSAFDQALYHVLKRALHHQPELRFPTCVDFLVAVRNAVNADQPLQGSFLKSCIGLQKQHAGPVSVQLNFWEHPDFLAPERLTEPHRIRQKLQEKSDRLQKESESLQRQLDRLLNDPVKVGVVGTRNAGKSSLFAIWSLFRNSSDDGVDLVISDNDTTRYLQVISADLLKGKLRANHYSEPPQHLQMKVSVHNRTWLVKTCDFTGEFLNSETNLESTQAAETLAFLREAEIILFLFDPDPNPQKLDWKIGDHIDRLFHEIPAELVLALTKIDEHWGSKDIFTQSHFRRIFEELCGRNPVLKLVANKLELSFSKQGLKIIPISSFGKKLPSTGTRPSEPQPLRVEQLDPFQIFSPLAAAFQRRSDQVKRLQYQLEKLSQTNEQLTHHLDVARDAVNKRQNEINVVAADMDRIRSFIAAARDRPIDKELQVLRNFQTKLPIFCKKLQQLGADVELQQCLALIGQLNKVISEFPRLKEDYKTRNLLKELKDRNECSVLEFLIFWFPTAEVTWALRRKVAAGVPDTVRNQFNEQYSLYIRRSVRIAATVIAAFIIFFLILLSR